jgi:4-amino-4-deoxy-L-arabinose transferase-like glycosyltransferase
MYLPHGALTFGYDQARDALVTQQILEGDLKVQGPPSSTPGLFHGVFYNYVLAPAYLVGHGSPVVAAYWIALLNAGTVFIIFVLAKKLAGSTPAALLASLLFAFSFEATQYATWLSNPTVGVWTVPLIYLGLWSWVKEKNKSGAILTGVGLGLSIQSEVFLGYHLVPVLIWIYIARKNLSLRQYAYAVGALLFSLSTMIIADAKFGFQSVDGIASLLSSGDAVLQSKKFSDFILLYLNQLATTFSNSLLPSNLGYGGMLGFVFIFTAVYLWQKSGRKALAWQPFMLTYVLAHTTVVPVGGVSTPFLLVGIGSGLVVLTALVLHHFYKTNKIAIVIILAIILVSNLSTIIAKNKNGSVIFSIQKDMLLQKQLKAIHYTYEEASGEPFSINSVTSPLWINIVWSYLYNWHGQNNYGYIPQWHGKDQVGLLQSLPDTSADTQNYFMIIEPLAGIPRRFVDEAIGEEDYKSELINETNFGEIVIQKRLRKTNE